MSLVKSLLFVFGVVLMFIIPEGESVLNENCMQCICEASTGCNVSSNCQDPSTGFYCGPFFISQPYWVDAGRPILANDNPENPRAFQNCALDLHCAAKTVRSYTTEFAQDCDGDGKISCSDYMRIHKLGGYECSGHVGTNKYFEIYKNCAAAVNVD